MDKAVEVIREDASVLPRAPSSTSRDIIACLSEAVTEQSRTIAAQADQIVELAKLCKGT